jgi:hypothetical protein
MTFATDRGVRRGSLSTVNRRRFGAAVIAVQREVYELTVSG